MIFYSGFSLIPPTLSTAKMPHTKKQPTKHTHITHHFIDSIKTQRESALLYSLHSRLPFPIHISKSKITVYVRSITSSSSNIESEASAVVESHADKIRRNDKSETDAFIHDWRSDVGNTVEVLDALKSNTVAKCVFINNTFRREVGHLDPVAFAKLSEVMKCNKSVKSLIIEYVSGILRNALFATMARSGGWSSIKELVLRSGGGYNNETLSLREADHLSSFINKSENLRTLMLEMNGDEVAPVVEALSRTEVQSLEIVFCSPVSLLNGNRRFATALERCTCITDLGLDFPDNIDQEQLFQILLIESIPKMLALKKLELKSMRRFDKQFFDMVGQCIGGHQGEIEELRLEYSSSSSANSSSIVGLAPALRRLKVLRFEGYSCLMLMPQQISELSSIASDCDTLERFGYNLGQQMDTEDFKFFCQVLSRFPSLKQVTQEHFCSVVDLREESRFVAFLIMVKTSKTIEQVPVFQCRNAEEEAAIKYHCRNNMVHNRIRAKNFLAAKVPSSAWQLILKEFSDMPDILYFLLQQRHGAMIGPTLQGYKRKQDFD